MDIQFELLEAAALALPVRDRARLARQLILSLDEEPYDDPAEVEQAWEEEIRRRIEEFESGAVAGIPASEVFAELRQRLATQ